MQPFDWLVQNYRYVLAAIGVFLILLIITIVIVVKKSDKKEVKEVVKEEEVKEVKSELAKKNQWIDPKEASKTERIMGKLPPPPQIYARLPSEEIIYDKLPKDQVYAKLPPEGTPDIIYEKLPGAMGAKEYYAQKLPAVLGVE